jgi:signal transduction histidine kinase
MRQLLQNLIGNALKFHNPGVPPFVSVQACVPALDDRAFYQGYLAIQYCEISVQDNGIGFEEKYLDRIFTPFERLHGLGEYEGSGIGLAVCRKIVERHRGTVTAHSVPGQGSRFVVTLPVKHPKGESP